MSTSPTRTMTEDELMRLPRGEHRYELVEGELRTMAPANSDHGVTVVNLTVPLGAYVKQQRLGAVLGAETGFTVSKKPDTVLAPNIAFVRRDRIPAGGMPRKYFPGAPDLAVEVVSPGDTVFEVDEKVQRWLAAGCRAVWVVNSHRRDVTVHLPGRPPAVVGEDELLSGGDVVAGFSLPVREIFQI